MFIVTLKLPTRSKTVDRLCADDSVRLGDSVLIDSSYSASGFEIAKVVGRCKTNYTMTATTHIRCKIDLSTYERYLKKEAVKQGEINYIKNLRKELRKCIQDAKQSKREHKEQIEQCKKCIANATTVLEKLKGE